MSAAAATGAGQSSRETPAGAGLGECEAGCFVALMEQCGRRSHRGDSVRDRRFSWLNPVPLLQSRNQIVGSVFGSQAGETAFLFLCSDVIDPAGGIEEYEGKVWCPYRGYGGPI